MEEASFTTAPPVFNGENYQTWVVRMTIHLQALDVWEAIEEDYEISPLGANPTMAQMKNHKEKKTRKAKAKACLFSAVSPLILTRIMQLESAAEIWKHLQEEYQGNERVRNMQVMNLIREFEMVRMKESQTIKDYAEQLPTIANKVRLLAKEFSDERVVQKNFVTLPEKYEATISSLENTKDLSSITLAELLNVLQALEQKRLMRQESSVEGAFQAKTQTNEGNTRRRKNKKNNNKPSNNNNQKTGTYPPCPHYKKTNHPQQKCWWRPDVKCNNVEEQLFSATCFANGSTFESWLVDSGCTNHMTYDQDLFREIDRTTISKVRIGNGEYIPVKGKGTVAIESLTGLKLISDVLFVPDIDQNLLSVGQLVEKGFKVCFEDKNCIIKDTEGREVFNIKMKGKSFALNMLEDEQIVASQHENNTMLWHKRLGHFHHNVVLYMKKNQIVEGLPDLEEELPICAACQYGKQTRLPFPQKATWKSTQKLQLVHIDVSGPQKTPSLKGSKYYIAFIDDFTRFCWIYFLTYKSEVADVFLRYKAMVENQSEYKIKVIRSDNGTEYTSEKFNKFCEDAGIDHQLTAPYTPQQNGVVERKNRTIMEMTRCLLHEKELPKSFWAEAANTAVFLLNRLPTKALQKQTPFEAWFGYKSMLMNLKTFGCLCFSYVPQVKRDKLDKKSEPGIFIGYSSTSKAYRIYLPQNSKIVVSRDVKFLETEKWSWDEQNQQYIDEDVDELPVRGFRTLFDIYQRCNIAVLEPAGFVEAAENKIWRVAMQEELNMIDKNNTWELVDRPSHKKPIGVKWVYRTKLNSDGSINKHKARLVVKGSKKMEDLSTRCEVSIFEWLPGERDFVEQPEGFAIKGKEEKVYLLKKALYGLRQAPRAWYSRIDTHLLTLGFHKSLSEFTLYIKKIEEDILIVSLYVDDLLVTGSNAGFVNKFKAEMEQVFEMTDLGEMSYFLGMEVHQKQNEIFIYQQKYAKEILKKFKMEECKPTSTPMNQKEKFCKEDGAKKVDEGLYRSMIGCLMYLTATRPDIMHVVSLLSRYMHCASEIHFQAAKRVIRYVKGTVDYGIKFSQVQSFNFHGFSDSDWAGCVDDMRSTLGYCFSFGSGVFSWSSRKQEVVAQSTAEAEYIAAVAAVNQALWLRKLLTDLDMKQEVSTKVFVDNQATISIANDPVFHDLSFYEKDLEFAAPKSRRSVESYALVAAEGKAEIVNHMQLKSTRLLEC
ncbi:Retrovirus-related Pol polyprotein from transposon RE1 [Vitis vinifera]|uniref:Retrovirus-related Pol polyprotein from transposon RE1 n=1 Tax=Vitis vinifera TaxID=29760 RepID=A0A438HDW8_VITVI|nr:Retrovirus-related Pol polyprotein from transposon RE1 [Vitis vinifera]